MRKDKLSQDLRNYEKNLVSIALLENKGNVAHAAESLGVNRTTLHERIKRLGLDHMKQKVVKEQEAAASVAIERPAQCSDYGDDE